MYLTMIFVTREQKYGHESDRKSIRENENAWRLSTSHAIRIRLKWWLNDRMNINSLRLTIAFACKAPKSNRPDIYTHSTECGSLAVVVTFFSASSSSFSLFIMMMMMYSYNT